MSERLRLIVATLAGLCSLACLPAYRHPKALYEYPAHESCGRPEGGLAAIEVVVRDPNNDALPGAPVYVAPLSYAGGAGSAPEDARHAYTDRSGTVVFSGLRGRHVFALTVAADSFPPEVRGVLVKAGCTVRLEIKLFMPHVPSEDLIR